MAREMEILCPNEECGKRVGAVVFASNPNGPKFNGVPGRVEASGGVKVGAKLREFTLGCAKCGQSFEYKVPGPEDE